MKLAAYAHSVSEFKELKKFGFEYVVLHSMLWPGLEGGVLPPEEQIQAVKAELKDTGLIPTEFGAFYMWYYLGLCGLMEMQPSTPSDPAYEQARLRGVKQFGKIVAFVRSMGCDQIFSLLGGRRVYHYDHEEAWRKSINDLAPALEREKVRVAFIPHPADFIEESDQCVDMIRSANCKQVGYVYVIPHTYVMAGRMKPNADAMIRYAFDAGILADVHMADTLRPAQMWIRDHFDLQPYHSHLVPGKGSLDIKSIVKTLVDIGYEGTVTMIPYRYGIDDKSFAELSSESKSYVESILREIK
jgi:myo-inositol catabolism protein IolH